MNEPAGLQCCKCKKYNAWRIKLRQCGHFVCVACILIHLKYWIKEENKARIKCPKKTCPKRIYENDIDAVLDPENDDLEAVYTEYDGCNFVQCVNIRCKQRFCWMCNEPAESLQHFAKIALFFYLLNKEEPVGYYGLPRQRVSHELVLNCDIPTNDRSTLKLYFGPLLVLITLPYQILLLIREFMRRMGKSPWAVTVLVVLLYPIMMLASVPFAVGSLLFFIPISTAYCAIAIIKCIPAFSRACDILHMMSVAAGCFGLDQWRIILRENYETNRQREVEIAQEEEELSERLIAILKFGIAFGENARL
ncbi:hypothetical protein DINM_002506 [Dirofilaria immitis]|nr:hypothetical protein [Dirofilaria immitis]